jgi:hypothetical protein
MKTVTTRAAAVEAHQPGAACRPREDGTGGKRDKAGFSAAKKFEKVCKKVLALSMNWDIIGVSKAKTQLFRPHGAHL